MHWNGNHYSLCHLCNTKVLEIFSSIWFIIWPKFISEITVLFWVFTSHWRSKIKNFITFCLARSFSIFGSVDKSQNKKSGKIFLILYYCPPPPRVNFTNVLSAAFTYVCCARSFLSLCFRFVPYWRKTVGKKAARRMLVKLTPPLPFLRLQALKQNG